MHDWTEDMWVRMMDKYVGEDAREYCELGPYYENRVLYMRLYTLGVAEDGDSVKKLVDYIKNQDDVDQTKNSIVRISYYASMDSIADVLDKYDNPQILKTIDHVSEATGKGESVRPLLAYFDIHSELDGIYEVAEMLSEYTSVDDYSDFLVIALHKLYKHSDIIKKHKNKKGIAKTLVELAHRSNEPMNYENEIPLLEDFVEYYERNDAGIVGADLVQMLYETDDKEIVKKTASMLEKQENPDVISDVIHSLAMNTIGTDTLSAVIEAFDIYSEYSQLIREQVLRNEVEYIDELITERA